MAYEKPVVTLVGNVNDILHHVCAGVDRARAADGWVLQLVREGWVIVVAPMNGCVGPYVVSVSNPAGVERYRGSNVQSVERAIGKAVNFLEAEPGVNVNRIELERLGRGIDRA